MSTPRFLVLPDGVRATRLPSAAGELAVLEAAPPAPTASPVLLVPGWTGSKEDFIAVVGPLAAAGHRVVALDLPGQYESPAAPGGSYDLEVFGAAVRSLGSALGAGPVHLVGHSFGGLAVTAATLQDPAAVRSVVLLCSGPGALPGDQHALIHVLADSIAEHGLGATWTAKRAYDRAHGSPEEEPHIEAFLQRRFTSNDPAALRAITLLLATARDRVDLLAATGVPVEVVTGVDDDRWPVGVQARMADRLGARHVLVEGAGHSPAVEAPDATVETLTRFWSEVEALPRAVGG
ncbi:MAG TPA: alpha/beta hydrolase [Jiangellales bacterium]|nr:alpha/beta hydrolase [Jiangellales bacterium]